MINWKYIFYTLISILLIGYIFISSKKIDNLKNQLLIEQVKNERIIDSLSFDCKLKEEQITILFNVIEKANHALDSLYLIKNGIYLRLLSFRHTDYVASTFLSNSWKKKRVTF